MGLPSGPKSRLLGAGKHGMHHCQLLVGAESHKQAALNVTGWTSGSGSLIRRDIGVARELLAADRQGHGKAGLHNQPSTLGQIGQQTSCRHAQQPQDAPSGRLPSPPGCSPLSGPPQALLLVSTESALAMHC